MITKPLLIITLLCCHAGFSQLVDFAGSFPWPPNIPNTQIPTDAIDNDDSRIIAWGNQVTEYTPGSNVSEIWMNTTQALGPAEGASSDIVSLGANGSITISFTTYLSGFAGKYQAGYGVPFDLSDLPQNSQVNPNEIRFVRVVDILGDGSQRDSLGNRIYDPTPTAISGGFDLDGIGVIHQLQESTYAQWVSEQSFSLNQSGENLDPDQDGASNLFEYWFGSDPLSSQERPEFSITKQSGTSFKLVYSEVTNQSEYDLILLVSPDLVEWTPLTEDALETTSTTLGPNRVRREEVFTTDQTSNFFQLELRNN